MAEGGWISTKVKQLKWRKLGRELLFWAGLLVALFSARWSLADHYQVPTGSMIPTVQVGDPFFVDKRAYDLRIPFTDVSLVSFDDPMNGDVVVLDSPEDDKLLLKRVAAIPGDRVQVTKGHLTINGEPIAIEETADGLVEYLGAEPHAVQLTREGGPDIGPLDIPADHYLVMGDNRGNSYDGRSFGLVRRMAIRGRVLGVYFRDGLSWTDL